MKSAFLGAGALGCYYGARLAESGQDVSFIMRSDYETVLHQGLSVQSVHGNISLPSPHVFRSPEDVGPVDLVVVTWKTTSNDQLAGALPCLMNDKTIVLTRQNGMGNAEAISYIVPADKIYIGLCFICAMRESAGKIVHLEGDDVQFAPFVASEKGTEKAKELAELFSRAHIHTKSFDHAEEIQWLKLVWNIPFNGLCLAKGGINIETLYQEADDVVRAREIMEEIAVVAKARGYELPDDIVDFQMSRAEKMGKFIPSSAVDYNMGRPIEYYAIWGNPLEKARQARVSIPEWERLDCEIRARIGLS